MQRPPGSFPPRPPTFRRPSPTGHTVFPRVAARLPDPVPQAPVPAPVVEKSNAGPDVVVGFTSAEAEFVIANCDKNIHFGLENLIRYQQSGDEIDRDAAMRLVDLMEQFKAVKAAVERGMKDQ